MMRYMKKSIALILSLLIMLSVLQGCSVQKNEHVESKESETTAETTIADLKNNQTNSVPEFEGLSDPRLTKYMEDAVYAEVIDHIDTKKYVVENVEAVYISKEYLEEAAYNNKSNIYFGYTKDELDKQFSGTKYVFTLGDDGKTTVEKFEPYDDTYDKILLNVAIGTGVILVCVVLTVATEGAGAPAAAAIFAASAKSGAIAAASSALIGGTAAGVITGLETEDFDESMKAAMLSGSEGLKWGAITGALTGGASEAIALKGATSGRTALLPKDTLNSKGFLNFKSKQPDGTEITNLQRMLNGNAPIDPATNKALQLHHIGQKADGTLAVLTESQHQGNSQILNIAGKSSEIDRAAFAKTREEFWKSAGKLLQKGSL